MLETGNPVSMPWRDKVKAIVQAWYPGQAGGQAIAEVLTAKANPSGRLPITFPESLAQTPRPELPGIATAWGTPTTIRYDEGAEVGYRWYAQKDIKPLYPFGHGLSYTSFAYSDLEVSGGETITASFTATNTGEREGADVPQLYLTSAPDQQRMRLLGFERVELAPGESREVTLTADPRLLARFDGAAKPMAHHGRHARGRPRQIRRRPRADRQRKSDGEAFWKLNSSETTDRIAKLALRAKRARMAPSQTTLRAIASARARLSAGRRARGSSSGSRSNKNGAAPLLSGARFRCTRVGRTGLMPSAAAIRGRPAARC